MQKCILFALVLLLPLRAFSEDTPTPTITLTPTHTNSPTPPTCPAYPSTNAAALSGPWFVGDAGDPGYSDGVPHVDPVAGTPNWGGTIAWMTQAHDTRLRVNGTVQKVSLYVGDLSHTTELYVSIWRDHGDGTFDRVGETGNLLPFLTSEAINTLQLPAPIADVRIGDYLGGRIVGAGPVLVSKPLRIEVDAITYTPVSYVINGAPTDNYSWTVQTSTYNAVPIQLWVGRGPQVAFFGDSIVSGAYVSRSYMETSTFALGTPAQVLDAQFAALTGLSIGNNAHFSWNTQGIATVVEELVPQQHPRYVILEGGANDMRNVQSKAQFLANWTRMLNAASAEESVVQIFVTGVWPQYDDSPNWGYDKWVDWQTALQALTATYQKAVWIDMSQWLGTPYPYGPPGNHYRLLYTPYSDGIHLYAPGMVIAAHALASGCNGLSLTPVPTWSPTPNPTYTARPVASTPLPFHYVDPKETF